MSQYLVLIYGDEAVYAEGGPGLQDEVMKGHHEFGTTHGAKLAGGNALQGVDTATSIRTDASGAFTVTDGPFLETKEALGGYYLIDAESLDEAIEWAAKIPSARDGKIEIRPVVDRTGAGA